MGRADPGERRAGGLKRGARRMSSILTSQVFQILWLDFQLSGDEVALIALICRGLPSWPQRLRGVIIGAVVAVALHMILTGGFVVTPLLPPGLIYIQLIAALIVIWLVIKLLADAPTELSGAIWFLAVGNLFLQIMRADNVVAIGAAAHGDLSALLAGLAATLPLVIIGAVIILALLVSRLCKWFVAIALGLLIVLEFALAGSFNPPIIGLEALLIAELLGLAVLVWALAAQFGWSAGELFVDEPLAGQRLIDAGVKSWMIAAAGAAIVLLLGWLARRGRGKALPVAPERAGG